MERVPEIRLETVVPDHLAGRAAEAAIAAHPYEETALDVYPIEGHPNGCGYGRRGTLPDPTPPERLVDHVSERLGFPARLVADPGRRIESVAALGGSGGSFLRQVAASGADAYVTGDISYHDVLLAESLGLTVIDAGHAATELPSLEPLARRLAALVDLPVEVSRVRRRVMPDLREDWWRTQLHLGNARDLLLSPAREAPEIGSLGRFQGWLEHNELELALDELEGLGEINVCPPRFWRELLRAARIMGLRDHSARYEAKLGQFP